MTNGGAIVSVDQLISDDEKHKNKRENKVYIISGPAGVGKSTIAKALVKSLPNSSYISGDYISHMHVNGRKKPWESQEESSLIWENILSLTKNFLKYGNNVVIDYVAFPKEAKWLKDNIKQLNIELHYVVLWTDSETLISRDTMRIPEHRMGKRCLVLLDEFSQSGLDEKYRLATNETTAITYLVNEIMKNPIYIMT